MGVHGGIALAYGAAFLGGYLLGAIPFGLIFTKWAGLGDIRQIGSGNIGTTNVLRTGNRAVAGLTLLADVLKGAVPVVIAAHWGMGCAIAAAVGAFIGHVAPVWLRFRGGKGVATYIGVLIGLAWPAAIIFCMTWLLVAFATRYSSLSALIAAVTAPLYLATSAPWPITAAAAFLSLILYIRHAANIVRLVRGEEPQIGGS